jgi:putative oxidoreductase
MSQVSATAMDGVEWQAGGAADARSAARYVQILGRVLFSAVFIGGGLGHFSRPTIEFAAAQGVPLASALVPLSGLMALAGGLSILFGYRVKWGAALVVAFLLPVTFTMHRFWGLGDPHSMMAQVQMAMFMKNLALIGAALLIARAPSVEKRPRAA